MQCRLADELGAQAGHTALGKTRLVPEEIVCRDRAEDRIAKELQALIALAALSAVFVGIGAVGQGCQQQMFIRKNVSDFLLKLLHRRRFRSSYSRYCL